MTEIEVIKMSERLLWGKLDNDDFIKLVSDIVRNPEHMEIYKTLKLLFNYMS